MTVQEINSLEEFKTLTAEDQYVAIDFWAEWCGPCRMISPVYDKLSGETEGVKFYKVNVDDQPEIAQEAGVRVLPTFKLFKNGKTVGDSTGANVSGLTALIRQGKSNE